jgi:thiamine-monophosphate kinase
MSGHPIGSEQAFLDLIDLHFPRAHNNLLLERGDDCAVIPCPERLCISTDLFLEDIHFRRSYFSPEDIGYKSLAVNVSDIAAMGGKPMGFSLGLMIPPGLNQAFFSCFFKGMAEICQALDLPLTGGDLSLSSALGVCITIWGEAGEGTSFLTRSGNRPGDVLFLSGDIGLARIGLSLLEENGPVSGFPESISSFLRPKLRIRDGLLLGSSGFVSSLMDVSDGLAMDLPRLLGSKGAEITLTEDALHPELLQYCRAQGQNPLEAALLGGEDYALLGTVGKDDLPRLKALLPKAAILGRVRERPGIVDRNGAAVQLRGFDHFSGERPWTRS